MEQNTIPCNSNHEQIMSKLAQIEARMDKDWEYNEALSVYNETVGTNIEVISVNDDLSGGHQIYQSNGRILSNTSTRHTASGISWELKPTKVGNDATFPVRHMLPAVPCKSGVAITASIWLYRSNTGVTGIFGMRGLQIAGATTDLSDPITVGATTWENLTLTFTPSEDGVVEFYVDAYGGTTYSLFWDDFSVSAASYIDASSGDYPFMRTGAYIGENGTSGGGGGLTEFSSTFS